MVPQDQEPAARGAPGLAVMPSSIGPEADWRAGRRSPALTSTPWTFSFIWSSRVVFPSFLFFQQYPSFLYFTFFLL